jgi:membrane protease subunit HflC
VKHKLRWLAIAMAVGAIAGIAFASLVVVDETEFVVVTRFGRIAAVFGDDPSEAGLHAKAPWELAIKIDRRFRVFDPPPREVMTGDRRNLEVAPYVVWRVADPVVFLQGSGSHELAEARLNERVSAGLSDAIGRRDLASLASTDAAKWSLDGLTRDVLQAVAPSAREELGVEVIDVRLRRFGHPVEVRPAVFDLIRSERRQVAAKLRAEGEAQYLTITSQADRARDTMIAEAEAEARRIRGHAEAEATRLLNEAHGRDPRFFEFLRTLEAYRSILDERATIVLTASSPLLKLLVEGPATPAAPSPASSSPREAAGAVGSSPLKNAARQP